MIRSITLELLLQEGLDLPLFCVQQYDGADVLMSMYNGVLVDGVKVSDHYNRHALEAAEFRIGVVSWKARMPGYSGSSSSTKEKRVPYREACLP